MSDKYFVDAKATREFVADYLTWQIVVKGGESILEALDLEARFQISFWDALVVQAAQASGVEILYSEDLSDGHSYGSVRVIKTGSGVPRYSVAEERRTIQPREAQPRNGSTPLIALAPAAFDLTIRIDPNPLASVRVIVKFCALPTSC